MDVETGASLLSRCPELPRHRWTVDEYHRMSEVGLLDPDVRVELIEGEIVEMAPIGDLHAAISNRLNRLLVVTVGERGIVAVGNPVRLNQNSEPRWTSACCGRAATTRPGDRVRRTSCSRWKCPTRRFGGTVG